MSYTQRLDWNHSKGTYGGGRSTFSASQPCQLQEYSGLLIEQKQQREVVNEVFSSGSSSSSSISTGTRFCCFCQSTLDILRHRKYCTWLVLLLVVQAFCIVNFVWDTHANYVGTHRIVDVDGNGTANGTVWNATEPLVELNVTMIEASDGGECVENFFRLYGSFCRLTLLPGGRSASSDVRELCPCIPSGLTGKAEKGSLSYLQSVVEAGGSWSPGNCTARQRLAVIVPFRDRETHLTTFLQVLHPFLQRQLVEYTIFVVEQDLPRDIFNKASVMNAGFVEVESLSASNTTFDCFLFHDVDLLPLDDRNFYGCGARLPRHVGAFVDKWNYKLYYYRIFGGATSFRGEVFKAINGFSNEFYGWGGEDDDMLNRIEAKNMTFIRFPLCVAKYNMIRHESDKRNPYNKKSGVGFQVRRELYSTQGLNSVRYTVVAVERRPLYTWILVNLPPGP